MVVMVTTFTYWSSQNKKYKRSGRLIDLLSLHMISMLDLLCCFRCRFYSFPLLPIYTAESILQLIAGSRADAGDRGGLRLSDKSICCLPVDYHGGAPAAANAKLTTYQTMRVFTVWFGMRLHRGYVSYKERRVWGRPVVVIASPSVIFLVPRKQAFFLRRYPTSGWLIF
jgi:hypothetical protein